jgi:flagellin
MPLSINTNIASLTAQRAMLNSNAGLEQSFERLSTGKRVNSAADDAAGLAIGKDLESRVSGLNQAIRNVNDGISMVQIAEGALDETTTILQRMRDLAVQAANGSMTATEQGYLDAEHEKLAATLGSVVDQSQFNGTDLVNDASKKTISIQSGADAGVTTSIAFAAMTENTLGVDKDSINLAGSGSSSAETATISGFDVRGTQVAAVHNFDGLTIATTSGSETGTYTVNIAGTDFTSATAIAVPSSMANLVSHLNAITGVSDFGSFAPADSNADLAFTFNAANAGVQAATTIKSTGYTSDVSLTSAVIDGNNGSTEGVGGTTAVGDVYTLTVGSDTFATAAATATTQYTTNKDIAAALQTTLTNEGITHFTIATASGANFGNFVVTYAEEGNQGATAYSVAKTTGDVGTDSTAVSISDGASKASDAIDAIDKALAKVASERATLGATQQQLESTVRNLANVAENTAAAQGRIMDTDYAAETANLTKAQILQQAATSILAQANAQPQSVLSLLQ